MEFLEILRNNRSYRGFAQTPVTRAQIEKMVSAARLAGSSGNRQPLKYFLSCDPDTNARIQPLTHWGAALRNLELPREGHRPTAFIIICHDESIAANPEGFQRDVGIAAQTILLTAASMGLGGCMIGNFDGDALAGELLLPEEIQPQLVLGLGVPDEKIVLVDAQGDTRYYRDEQDVHYVPKRPLKELLLN